MLCSLLCFCFAKKKKKKKFEGLDLGLNLPLVCTFLQIKFDVLFIIFLRILMEVFEALSFFTTNTAVMLPSGQQTLPPERENIEGKQNT